MRRWYWPALIALAAFACDDDGSTGGSDLGGIRPDGGRTDMNFEADMDRPLPDMAQPDMRPPVDMQVDAADMRVEGGDMHVEPDMAQPDMMVEPDMAPPECEAGQTQACGDCVGGQQLCDADGTWGPCVFPAERCNALDDDCDGQTDEDFDQLGEVCSVGVGACASAGAFVCTPDGEGVTCNAVSGMPQAEICDGLDNDCDEVADEALQEACYDGPDGTLGTGACLAGVRRCVDGAFGACQGAVLPGDETCDGVDEDCDGTVDEAEGGAALVEACYDGAPDTQGVGTCRGGQRTCADGAFGPCDGQVLPGNEICDLADNDCNGAIDDTAGGCECQPGSVQACYTGPEGTAGVGTCLAGSQRCDQNGQLGACEGESVPEAELCDGVDNDCDGNIDNGVPGAGVACEAGVGACRAQGATVCDGAQGQVICDAQPGDPSVETCDGVDNDCDGQIDEGLGLGEACRVGQGACAANGVNVCDARGGVVCDARPGEPRLELCNAVDDDCDGQTDEGFELGAACEVGVGACVAAGVRECNDVGQTQCSATPGDPAPEACDGLDNDCDGQADEGNPGGGQDCNTGAEGVCAAGLRVCEAGGFTCIQLVEPGPEVCDGLDNDCNGRVDDDGRGVLTQRCYTGPRGTEGVGTCQSGRQTCENGAFGGCVGEVVPRPESCDSLDNDCNGAIDDVPAGECVCEPGATQACYTGAPGTEGVGVCRAGQQTCQPDGQGFGPCGGEVLPGAEICDGSDNDCNGRVDDAAGVGVACTDGIGECSRPGQLVCDARSGQLVCDAQAGEPQPEICDGLDNDCDGNRDNVDGLGDRCTNGIGQCARAGNRVCDLNNQVLVCNAEPGRPEPEVCDGIDNDCDRETDENVPDVGRRCVVGVGECRVGGATICAGREGIQCDAEPREPGDEICDLRDNDCDGEVDEEAQGVGTPCTNGQGACERDGQQVCSPNGGLFCNARPGIPSQELCNGADDDCNGEVDEDLDCTVYRSCAHARQEGGVADGIYVIDADGDGPGAPQSVWCDQTTDGGGWTLVGSTQATTLNDQRSDWYADLLTLAPSESNPGIWDGLRPLGTRFDVRFTCRADIEAADAPFDVDLSFYDTPWYTEFTTGTDGDSCFSETNGIYDDSPVPARRDNIGQRFRRRTERYGTSGYLEGEDSCADAGDFTVDFDDRGLDANQSDGTDWGEDDSLLKCGASGLATGQWFVWARERPRVAVVGLHNTVTTELRAAGLLADRLSYGAALPAQLTHEAYDTIVIGRYANNWGNMTQALKEALDVFGRSGGNIVTEWDGAAIFMSTYDQSFRYREGAPTQLAWFGGRIGHGDVRGSDTAITQTQPGDPLFDGVDNPFSADSATQFFFTLDDVGGLEFPVVLQSETMATFPGGDRFPDGTLSAIERGRYCGGHTIFASFDWQDEADHPGLGNLVPNLVRAANSPPPAHLDEACKATVRPIQMRCGDSDRDVAEFGITGRLLFSCEPNDDVQVLWVTRSGVADLDANLVRSYLNNGGIVVGEYGISDELHNLIYNSNLEQGARFGNCRDNVMPVLPANLEDGFWQDNRHASPGAQSGCGFDLSGFPHVIKLGGWTPESTQIAYRDQGRGRVWFVEADWQDPANTMSDASRGLMHYMATHAAGGVYGRGARFSGVRQNQNINTYLQRGFTPCLTTAYNSTESLADIQSACHGDVLMLACREAGSNVLNVAAVGRRAEIFEDVGNGAEAVNPHNGVNWYYSEARSWGFAPGGQAVSRNTCDTTDRESNTRLCWHTGNASLRSGWRCGSNVGLNGGEWERVILHHNGDQP